MNEKIVTNIFWSQGYEKGGQVYILYSDCTYEAIHTKHSPNEWNIEYMSFKKFADLRILRQKKYTREQALQYIQTKDDEFKSFRELEKPTEEELLLEGGL